MCERAGEDYPLRQRRRLRGLRGRQTAAVAAATGARAINTLRRVQSRKLRFTDMLQRVAKLKLEFEISVPPHQPHLS